MELQGKIAIVTGAAKGIGFAVARAFAREGARVVVNDIRADAAEAAAKDLGAAHIAAPGDVARESDVRAMVDGALGLSGRIDILVNNAGVADSFVPTIEQSLAHWQRLIDVHLTGTYLVSKTVAPHMMRAGSGAIINVSSIAGVLGLPVRTAYSAAKAGIAMMTRTLGSEWAPHGVRVNAVAPGYIRTDLTDRLIAEGKLDSERIQRRTPMGRWGRRREVAEAILFLASDRASFITGATLAVDGGYMAWGGAGDAFSLDQLPAGE